eukprot:Rmarinus@m.3468
MLAAICTALLIPCTSRGVETVMMFMIRMFSSGTFQIAYVYTPELYPTSLRSTGLGVCSAVARVSGMVTPYIAQMLASESAVLALVVYLLICVISAIAASALSVDTRGTALADSLTGMPY